MQSVGRAQIACMRDENGGARRDGVEKKENGSLPSRVDECDELWRLSRWDAAALDDSGESKNRPPLLLLHLPSTFLSAYLPRLCVCVANFALSTFPLF